MAFYTFEDKVTGERETLSLSFQGREEYLANNPNKFQVIVNPQGFIAGHGNKPDDGFRDLLREMKKHHPNNTIDTF